MTTTTNGTFIPPAPPITTIASYTGLNVNTTGLLTQCIPSTTGIQKYPVFTPDSPDLFFLLMEAALRQQGITDKEQIFLSTLMQLPYKVQIQAKNLVNSAGQDKLEKLKHIVETQYCLPAEERLRKLLQTTSMGDMRPSEYLHHIRELQGSEQDKNSTLIRTFFLQSLPSNIAPLVRLMYDTHDLDAIAKAADNCINYCGKPDSQMANLNSLQTQNASSFDPQISLLSEQLNNINLKSSTSVDSKIEALRSEVDFKINNVLTQLSYLSGQLNSMQQAMSQQNNNRYSRPRDHSRSRSTSRDRGTRRNESQNRNGVCYYHERFGDQARKCILPCSYPRDSGNL